MKLTRLSVIIILFLSYSSYTQLIKNPGFETVSSIPTEGGQIHKCIYWYNGTYTDFSDWSDYPGSVDVMYATEQNHPYIDFPTTVYDINGNSHSIETINYDNSNGEENNPDRSMARFGITQSILFDQNKNVIEEEIVAREIFIHDLHGQNLFLEDNKEYKIRFDIVLFSESNMKNEKEDKLNGEFFSLNKIGVLFGSKGDTEFQRKATDFSGHCVGPNETQQEQLSRYFLSDINTNTILTPQSYHNNPNENLTTHLT